MRTLTLAWFESESAVSYYTYNDEPNSVDISRTLSSELLPTFLVIISDSEVNQIILDSRRSESFRQVFKTLTLLMPLTHADLIASVGAIVSPTMIASSFICH